jgi:hypothetical protein
LRAMRRSTPSQRHLISSCILITTSHSDSATSDRPLFSSPTSSRRTQQAGKENTSTLIIKKHLATD